MDKKFSRLLYIFLAGLLIWVVGCTSKSNPVAPQNSPTNSGQPEDFGYTLDGTSFERFQATNESTEAFAERDSNWGLGVVPGSWLLGIQLIDNQIGFGTFHTRNIEIYVPFISPSLGTFPIVAWDNPSGADAAVLLDSINYYSLPGGSITITKFDTVGNLVSGTFSFSAFEKGDSSNVKTITQGFFNDVGIYVGTFGQGTITASANGMLFTTRSASRVQPLSAFMVRGTNELTIEAFNTTLSQSMLLSIDNPAIGTFNLKASQNPFGPPSYSGPAGTINAQDGAAGTITISAYDPATRRFSATFQFSGIDPTTGQKIDVANGEIDSVQWSVL